MESGKSFFEIYFSNSSVGAICFHDELYNPNRPEVDDQELMAKFDSIYRSWKENNIDLLKGVSLDEPSSYFLSMQEGVEAEAAVKKSWKTPHGEWCQRSMSAIPNTSRGNSPNSPKFVGTKTTLEFKPTDAKKGVLPLGMIRYNMLTTRENSDGLHLEEDLALCHVYPLEGKDKANRKRNRTRCAGQQFEDFAPPELNKSEQVMSELDFKNMHPLSTGDYSIDNLVRPGSDKWDSFTKIYTKNPKLMYAACNRCNTMLKLTSQRGPASSCGTSSLESHSKSIRCTQKQLHGNSSTIIEDSVVEIGGSLVEIEMPQ